MFFRNLTLFRFPPTFGGLFDTPVAAELADIEGALRECALKSVGPQELSSRGFVPPLGRDSESFMHRVGDAAWIAVGGEDKILPGAVVNDLLAKKLDELEEREGVRPGSRARKRLKEELVTELLPKAFVQPVRTDAYFDLARGFIAVDTSSRKAAESVVSEVRRAAGSFPALPINAEVAPRTILTGWLAGDALPEGLTLGEECELRDASSNGAVVRVQRLELQSDEIAKHLEAGLQCTRLALVYEDHVSFVLGEDLVLRKVRFLDGPVEELEHSEREDLRAELDARFVLMSGELGAVFDMLERAFRISRADLGGSPAPEPEAKRAVRAAAQRLHDMAKDQGVTMTISGPGLQTVVINGQDEDPLLAKAEEIVRATRKPSISALQRVLKLGYNRAARLLEALEVRGVVSPPAPDGTRIVLPTTKEIA